MVFIWQIIFGASAVVCFGSFVWAVKNHFAQTGRMPSGMRLISHASLTFFALQMFAIARLERINLPLAASAVALYAASFTVFWLAIAATRQQRLTLAFSDDEPQHLQIAGVYRFVRHPFYLSYLLFWTAGFVAAGNFWLIFTVAAMFALYFRAARLEEAKFTASPLSADYSQYRAKIGMFLPKIRRFESTPEMFHKSREK